MTRWLNIEIYERTLSNVSKPLHYSLYIYQRQIQGGARGDCDLLTAKIAQLQGIIYQISGRHELYAGLQNFSKCPLMIKIRDGVGFRVRVMLANTNTHQNQGRIQKNCKRGELPSLLKNYQDITSFLVLLTRSMVKNAQKLDNFYF